MNLRQLLAKAPAYSVPQVLEKLAAHFGAEPRLPSAVLHLSNGTTVQGAVASVNDRGGNVLVLEETTGRVIYLGLEQVVAVSVLPSEPLVGWLSGGQVSTAQPLAPVGQLAFRRFVQAQAEALATQLGQALPWLLAPALLEGPDDFALPHKQAGLLAQALGQIAQDEMGRHSLVEKVGQISLAPAGAFAVALASRQLTVSLAPTDSVTLAQMTQALERVL
jgi:hypothetical protein